MLSGDQFAPVFVPQPAAAIPYGQAGAAGNEIGNLEEPAAPPAQSRLRVNLKLTLDI